MHFVSDSILNFKRNIVFASKSIVESKHRNCGSQSIFDITSQLSCRILQFIVCRGNIAGIDAKLRGSDNCYENIVKRFCFQSYIKLTYAQAHFAGDSVDKRNSHMQTGQRYRLILSESFYNISILLRNNVNNRYEAQKRYERRNDYHCHLKPFSFLFLTVSLLVFESPF